MSKKFHNKRKDKPNPAKALIQPNKRRNKIILLSILVITLGLFAKSINYYFVTWDDPQYLVDNSLIRNLSFHGLIKIFTTPVIGMYNPIPFLAYSVVYKFFGLDPNAYHFLNLLLHFIATIIAFKFIFQLTKRYETAAIVALLFAIHPMHVSVAVWISQTKTSLCAIFYFSALISYTKYLQENYKIKHLYYVGAFYILAVLSKPDAVTLTPVLFLLDYYLSRKLDKKLFLEKIPFLILSLLFGILTLATHANEGDSIFNINTDYSLLNKLLIANYSIVFYFEKLFLPLNLSTIYPYPDNAILPLKYFISLAVIPGLLLLIYKAGKFRKEIIFGLLFFVVSISVLIRIIPSGGFMSANRYSYISYTGLFFILGQYITYILDNKFSYSYRIKNYVITTLFVFIIFCAYRTTIRVSKWENSITLFDDVIKKYPKIMEAYTNRGFAKAQMGDDEGAYVDYNTAIDLNPKATQTYLNRALLLSKMGKDEEAIADFNKVIEFNPKFGEAYLYRAMLKKKQEDNNGAMQDFKRADSLGVKAAREQIELLNSGPMN